MRKLTALALTAVVAFTVAATAAPAHALKDTTWGCPTCIVAHPHR